MDISYFGKPYHGWQRQTNARTVQEDIENALSTILRDEIQIVGSGRTDTGVHAVQQVAHFEYDGLLDKGDLQFKLNSFLPEVISINGIMGVFPTAHARFDATSRTYHYQIHTEKSPFLIDRSCYLRGSLDLDSINEACQKILSWKDFECFCRVKTDVEHFNCNIFEISWQSVEKGHIFIIKANRFLRGMVRAIVGTLIEVGQSKLSLPEFDLILKNKDRTQAGKSVPAEGLYLAEVMYPKEIYQ